MISSMTGYARQSAQGSWGNLVVEIRSVNQRFLDLSIRLPDMLREFDPLIRAKVQSQLTRGKVEVQVKYQPGAELSSEMTLNKPLAQQVIKAADEVAGMMTHSAATSVTDILKWPMVMQMQELDVGSVKAHVEQVLEQALAIMVQTRQTEGEKLKALLLERIEVLTILVDEVKPLVPKIIKEQRQKLLARIEELQLNTDGERVEQEIILLAQRLDVSEEIDRLVAHIQETVKILKTGGVVGRRLDFLMQELNREANTLGSKSASVSSSHASVDLKVIIEQMREQIQNIE